MQKVDFPTVDCNDYGLNTMIAIGITIGIIGTFLGLAVSKSTVFPQINFHPKPNFGD